MPFLRIFGSRKRGESAPTSPSTQVSDTSLPTAAHAHSRSSPSSASLASPRSPPASPSIFSTLTRRRTAQLLSEEASVEQAPLPAAEVHPTAGTTSGPITPNHKPPRLELEFVRTASGTKLELPRSTDVEPWESPTVRLEGEQRRTDRISEKEIMEKRWLTADQVAVAWRIAGADLVRIASHRPGVFRCQYPSTLPLAISDKITALYAIFLVSISPHEFYPSLPSAASHFPPPDFASDDHDWTGDFATASGWVNEVEVLEGFLMRILRRLRGDMVTATVNNDLTGLPIWYERFVKEERQLSFPSSAFSTSLDPKLDRSTFALLASVLDVAESLALNGAENGLNEAYLSGLLGWWTLGSTISQSSGKVEDSWQHFQTIWAASAAAFSHLLKARIRDRARHETLPLLLVRMIEGYQGAQPVRYVVAADSVRVRRIALKRECSKRASLRYTPKTLLSIALVQAARCAEILPPWLTEETLGATDQEPAQNRSWADSPKVCAPASSTTATPPMLPASSSAGVSNFESAVTELGAPFSLSPGSPIRGSTIACNTAPGIDMFPDASFTPDWHAFAKTGFGEVRSPTLTDTFTSPGKVRQDAGPTVASPETPSGMSKNAGDTLIDAQSSLSPRRRDRRSMLPRSKISSQEILDAASAEWTTAQSEEVDLPAALVSLIEETSGDGAAHRDWPSFALIRRAPRLLKYSGTEDRVLITVEDVLATPSCAAGSGSRQLTASASDSRQIDEGSSSTAVEVDSTTASEQISTVPMMALSADAAPLHEPTGYPPAEGSIMSTLKRGRRKSLNLLKAFASSEGPGKLHILTQATPAPTLIGTITPLSPVTRDRGPRDSGVGKPLDASRPDACPSPPNLGTSMPSTPLRTLPLSPSTRSQTSPISLSHRSLATRPHRADSNASQRSVTRKPVPPLLNFEGNEGKLSVDGLRDDFGTQDPSDGTSALQSVIRKADGEVAAGETAVCADEALSMSPVASNTTGVRAQAAEVAISAQTSVISPATTQSSASGQEPHSSSPLEPNATIFLGPPVLTSKKMEAVIGGIRYSRNRLTPMEDSVGDSARRSGAL